MRNLVIAADPSTPAGSRLPGGFADAICAPLGQLAAAIDDADAGGDITAAWAAARAFASVAATAEDAWTPELRAALAALAGAGVTRAAEKETAGEAVTGLADPGGADLDDLDDLLRDLIVAIDHTTAAGSPLPGGVDAAIGGARRSFSAAWRERSGEDNGSVLAAVRGLAAAAAPHEDAWTPELRAALAALAGAGVDRAAGNGRRCRDMSTGRRRPRQRPTRRPAPATRPRSGANRPGTRQGPDQGDPSWPA